MLGSSSELNLTYGNFYYLDMSINGNDVNWTSPSGSTVNRIQFQSQNGQISAGQIQFNSVNSSHLNSTGTYYMGRLEIANISALPLNVSGVLFVNGSTGNVGIGTASPGNKLTLATLDNDDAIPALGSNGGKLGIFRTNTGSGLAYGMIMGQLSSGNGFVQVQRVDGTATAYNLLLQPSGGNVGIRTTNPLATLELGYNTAGGMALGQGKLWMAGGTDNNHYIQYQGAYGMVYQDNLGHIFQGGNVGIGTTSPGSILSVKSTGKNDVLNLEMAYAGGGNWTFSLGNSGFWNEKAMFISNDTNIASASAALITFDDADNGRIGIGTSAPSYQLQLSRDSAAKPSTNTWTIASDARIKTDIRPFTDGLSVIEKIDPVWYQYNGKGGFVADGKDQIGVIGQDIQKAAPYTVNTYKAKLNPDDQNETELLNFNSHALTFVLINSVKELKAENGQLKQLVCLDHPDAGMCKK